MDPPRPPPLKRLRPRHWIAIDCACTVLLALGYAIFKALASLHGVPHWAAAAIVAVAVLPAAFRRRWPRGVLALVNDEPAIIAGRAVKAVDTTGAGDCFLGAVAVQLAGGRSIRDALDYANAAASICVQRMGAAPSMPTAAEVEAVLSTSRPGERRDP